MTKLFLLGIDGAPPQYVFGEWLKDLPNLKKLMQRGLYAKIETTVPPSTCVAWTSLFSGKEPSQHGVYSYTIRDGFAYSASRLVSSKDVRTEMIWEILSKNNLKSIVLNVPLIYPIEKQFPNCHLVSGFLAPDLDEKSIYPISYLEEIKQKIPNYMFDVNVGLASYKTEGKDELIEKVYKMTKQNFDLVFDAIKNKQWNFITCVLIGSDRLEHYFWSYIDKSHRYYKGDTKYKTVLIDYFKYIDTQLGKILEILPDDVNIIVSSDHGMDKMNCRFNMNDWLIKEGYLVLKQKLTEPVKLKMSNIDWSKTRVFSVGAYFARLYFNLEGREPEGIVTLEEYDLLQKEISDKLKLIKDDNGNKMDNKIYLPQEIYHGEFAEESPDIMIYFDNLKCGVNNDVGNEGLYSWATTTGSDDAGHAPLGTFVMAGPATPNLGDIGQISIYDVTPTILSIFGINKSEDFRGRIINNG